MNKYTLIKNGTVVNAGEPLQKMDILIKDGRIVKIAENIHVESETQAACDVIDASGFHIFPGLVDAHCHLRDPGQEYKEDIVSGTRSAAAGGFTDIACMPNTLPVVDNKAIVRYIVEKAAREGVVHVHPIGSVTKGLSGTELSEMGMMKAAGIVAVSDDGKPVEKASVMMKAMVYAHSFGLRVISHCEDADLAEGGSMNEGAVSTRLGLCGIPTAAEDLMVSREIILSEYTGIPVHIAHVSTATAVQMIRDAKKRGVPVTAETCPHYFTLTEEACLDYNTDAKMNPPLRTQKDLKAVITGLQDGTLDMIVTDHAPHHIDEKNVEFDKANNGILGFETALSLTYTFLVKPGVLTLSDVADKMAKAPAAMLGLTKKEVAVGSAADLTIFDTNATWTVDKEQMASKSRNTPFHGWTLQGMVRYTLVNGCIVVKDGKPVG